MENRKSVENPEENKGKKKSNHLRTVNFFTSKESEKNQQDTNEDYVTQRTFSVDNYDKELIRIQKELEENKKNCKLSLKELTDLCWVLESISLDQNAIGDESIKENFRESYNTTLKLIVSSLLQESRRLFLAIPDDHFSHLMDKDYLRFSERNEAVNNSNLTNRFIQADILSNETREACLLAFERWTLIMYMCLTSNDQNLYFSIHSALSSMAVSKLRGEKDCNLSDNAKRLLAEADTLVQGRFAKAYQEITYPINHSPLANQLAIKVSTFLSIFVLVKLAVYLLLFHSQQFYRLAYSAIQV